MNNPTLANVVTELSTIDAALTEAQAVRVPITLSGLEYRSWSQPGNVGNTGGGSSAAHGTFTSSAPGELVSVVGAIPYDNFYVLVDLTDDILAQMAAQDKVLDDIENITYTWSAMFPAGVVPLVNGVCACQSLEGECQINSGNAIGNCAIAADFNGSKMWTYFDYAEGKWISTGIPIDFTLFAPGKTVTMQSVFKRDPVAKTITHVSLAINGAVYPIGVTQEMTPNVQTPYFHAAYQLDSNGMVPPTPYYFTRSNVRIDVS